MKILHTADWHIGKKLHSYELRADFDRFIDFLCGCLREEAIDVLLISGDCFDLANPSSAARNQYYESLVRLKNYVGHIVITGGNHDSPAVLNAPRELMKALDLDVIGGLPENIEEAVIPLKNKAGEVETVVAAIPYLRNPDLRKSEGALRTYEQRLKALREGIADVFHRAGTACQELYPGVPALAMGHLFTAGIDTSESERDIQIGNEAAFKASSFDDYFEYFALGHIHKPQRVSADIPVFYSGSPLPLSFSEREDSKRVLVIDTDKGWEPKSIEVPVFRKLLKIKGTLERIRTQLNSLPESSGTENLIEIELHEKQYRDQLLHELDVLVADFEQPGYQIVKHRAHFDNQLSEAGELFEEQVELAELKPRQMFDERLKLEGFDDEEQRELESAFSELLEEIEQDATT